MQTVHLSLDIFPLENNWNERTRKPAITLASIGINLCLRLRAEGNAIGTVDFLADSLDLLLDRAVEVVEELELRLALADGDDSLSEVLGTGATLGPVVADDCSVGASSESLFADQSKLSLRVGSIIYVRVWSQRDERRFTYANWLIATMTLTPNFFEFWICLTKFLHPSLRVTRSSLVYVSCKGFPGDTSGPPPCILSALVVATITVASGFNPLVLHLMLQNFSIPISAPKPPSVRT
jgi:hypothetical protein